MLLSRRLFRAIVTLALSCSISSCASSRLTQNLSRDPIVSSLELVRTPNLAPTGSSSHPVMEPSPLPGTGLLLGNIEVADSVLLGELFLATAVPTNKPGVDVLELDTERAPKADLDRSTGQFAFRDVTPGKYGIIVWEPMSSAPVADPNTGETLLVVLEPDDVVDLGTLHFP